MKEPVLFQNQPALEIGDAENRILVSPEHGARILTWQRNGREIIRWPADAVKNSNSGVLVHVASGPVDRNTWPLCFQVQTKITRVGDLLPMAGAKFVEPLSTAPGAMTPQLERRQPDSEKPLGEWNSFDIVCRGDTLEVSVNGVLQNTVTRCEPHAGKIGIQCEGFPYELRNLRLTPLE